MNRHHVRCALEAIHKPCGQRREEGVPEKTMSIHKGEGVLEAGPRGQQILHTKKLACLHLKKLLLHTGGGGGRGGVTSKFHMGEGVSKMSKILFTWFMNAPRPLDKKPFSHKSALENTSNPMLFMLGALH